MIANASGRIILHNNKLKTLTGDIETTHEIQTEEEYHSILKTYFGLVVPGIHLNDMLSLGKSPAKKECTCLVPGKQG